MKPGRRLFLFSPFLLALGARGAAEPAGRPPRVFLVSGEDLVRTRALLKQGHAPLQPALDRLRREGERALELEAPSVMDKKLTPASGDKHDYFSYGPYWWPDPTKPAGLPYIRRDGEVNPESRTGTDDLAFTRVQTAHLAHVEPEGSQPHELARTRSLSYSLFNLEGLFACATLGRHVGIDWWRFTTKDGRSLHRALSYVAPYVDPARAWPRNDAGGSDRARLLPLLAQFLRQAEDPYLRALFVRHSPDDPANARWRLLYPATLFNAFT